LVRPTQWKRGKKFSAWHVRSLYWSDSFTAGTRELARYKSDLVGIQDLRVHGKSKGLKFF